MSTYKIWLPYQLVSLETKQRQQPTKEKHIIQSTQNHQNKKSRKTNKKEPKLSEIIKKTAQEHLCTKCQHQSLEKIVIPPTKTGPCHTAVSICVRRSQHTVQPTTRLQTTVQ